MGISEKDRSGFISINVTIKPFFSEEVDENKISKWITETERRCPVTDNIQSSTHINIKI